MARRIREFDWSETPIGPMETWSPALQMVVNLMLANRFPMILWWGPHFIQFYNDPYRPIPGSKHPRSLGQPASECWPEIWPIIGPLIETPFQGGPATWAEDILLEVNRHDFVEETHFTIAYSPVPDETVPGGIGGVLATVHEISGKVVGDRRVVVLRDLGVRSAEAKTAEQACAFAAQTLAMHPKDIPFALLYLIDPDRKQARLAGATGVAAGQTAGPLLIALEDGAVGTSPWPLTQVMQSEAMQTVIDLPRRLGGQVPPSPWSDPPQTAVVVPIRSHKAHYLAGFLVAGVSARLQLDDQYLSVLDLVSSQIAAAISNARDYEEERKRAEALAELDRAKTAFFSNVSHEFRTPLTLMLGPVEELLVRSHTDLPPAAKGQLEVVNRNGLRLLRLVNTLLDFSRIEAGRVQAVFQPTDLASFTTDLASAFRAATERAGFSLIVDCPKLPDAVYVDRDMWEKIVLNLVSNAFKFTFEGEIEVKIRAESGGAVLTVRDTGVGVPAEKIPRLFERFHRVPNMRSRTYEGSGIGLALVQELVRLHGGSIRAESRLGSGTTFIVTIPLGSEHLPPDRLGGGRNLVSTAVGAAPFVEEALRWLPEADRMEETTEPIMRPELMPIPCPSGEAEDGDGRPRILIADDNADMRHYLARLLGERYTVEAVPDGRVALNAAQERRPDLILSDVMMPNLDGFGLVRELRADSALKTIPIVLLSARAGEESRVEGLQQGADDYLIKPFSARELMARVAAHLEMARMRKESEEALRESEERFSKAYRLSPVAMTIQSLTDRCFVEVNDSFLELFGYTREEVIGHTSAELNMYKDPAVRASIVPLFQQGSIKNYEMSFQTKTGANINVVFSTEKIRFKGHDYLITTLMDITERKRAEEALRESEDKYRGIVETANEGIWVVDADRRTTYVNDKMAEILGYSAYEMIGKSGLEFLDEESCALSDANIVKRRQGISENYELKLIRKDKTPLWVLVNATPLFHTNGEFAGTLSMLTDITERKQMEEELRKSHEELEVRVQERTAELTQSKEQLRILASQILSAQENERKRIALEIHDVLGSSLSAIKFKVEEALQQLPREGAANIAQPLETLIPHIQETIAEARRIQNDLRPPHLDDLGILATLAWFCRRFETIYSHIRVGQAITLREEEVPDPLKVVLFRITQEAMNNIGKHARADTVHLGLQKADGKIELSIRDNGEGFDPEALSSRDSSKKGLGLSSMKERVEFSGGSFSIDSAPGKGTVIRAVWSSHEK
ncbi:MAG: PAS domain S-box protein [Deltaproteobacteria bacterium]|nr:PAS domain S-box protein [Deltaproteobacteria bacterium]